MSFDLYLWHEPAPITATQALAICHRLAEGDDDAAQPDPGNLAFHAELVARFPGLEALSDAEVQSSPWNMSPDVTDRRVILSISWSRASEIERVALELGDRHGLLCFDPQNVDIHNPPKAADVLRLEFTDGSAFDDPSPADMGHLLAGIDAHNWYAWLERRPGWFVQVGRGGDAGAPEGRFVLEYREGAPGRHFRTVVDHLDDVVRAFSAFADSDTDTAWKNDFTWTSL